jgi:hypothetical protein
MRREAKKAAEPRTPNLEPATRNQKHATRKLAVGKRLKEQVKRI